MAAGSCRGDAIEPFYPAQLCTRHLGVKTGRAQGRRLLWGMQIEQSSDRTQSFFHRSTGHRKRTQCVVTRPFDSHGKLSRVFRVGQVLSALGAGHRVVQPLGGIGAFGIAAAQRAPVTASAWLAQTSACGVQAWRNPPRRSSPPAVCPTLSTRWPSGAEPSAPRRRRACLRRRSA